MKFLKNILSVAVVGLVLALSIPARAEIGFDTFSALRTFQLTPPTAFSAGTAVTNYIDRVMLNGVAIINVFANTNPASTGTLTWQLFTGSTNAGNWTAITNYALISSTTAQVITNLYAGTTNALGTNTLLLPGTWTSPTASTASYNTPYLLGLPFTNTAAVTCAGQWYQAAVHVLDQNRYIAIVWTPSATSGTNWYGGAEITSPFIGGWY